jgi:phospholipid transport system substrate-binding protein
MRSHLLLCSLIGLVAAAASAATVAAPDRLVAGAVDELADVVSECRLPLAADPAALRGLVDVHVRPRIDLLHAGQIILGRWWRDATPDERRRFSEGLYSSLASRYAPALLLLTPSTIEVPAAKTETEDEQATVRIVVRGVRSAPVPVDLKLRRLGEDWRVYDARWEDLSFLLQLREAVSEEVRRDGLEAVIRRLESGSSTSTADPAHRDSMAGRCLRQRGDAA